MKRMETTLIFQKNGNVFGAIVVILFIITLIGMSGLLYWEKEKVSQQYVTAMEKAEHEQKTLREALNKKELSLEKTSQRLKTIEKQYEEIQAKHKTLEKDYASALDIRTYISQQFEQFATKNTQRWEAFDSLTEKFGKELSRLSVANTKLLKDDNKKSSKKRSASLEKGVIEIPTVVVKDGEKSTRSGAASQFSGGPRTVDPSSILKNAQVMSINREHNFVVLNKGLVDGVDAGDQYIITRAGIRIATIKISEIRDFVSLGLVQEPTKTRLIQEGDKIAKMK